MRHPKYFNIVLLAMALMLTTMLPTAISAFAAYAPLGAAGDTPKVAAHLVRLKNDVVELALQVLAPGKILEAIRIDNLGGVSSHWRSDGKDKAAPLSVSKDGDGLSSGDQTISFALGDAETLLSLSLKDNGAFAGKDTDFRVTVFFADGERAMCSLSAGDFPAVAPVPAVHNNSEEQTEDQASEASPQIVASVRKAAEQGDAEAQYTLGVMYGAGDGVAADGKQAAGWLHKAAEQGYPAAQYALGFMYRTGNGVAKNRKQAAELFHRAANQGNPDAQYVLGLLYGEGVDVAQDDRQAMEWFSKAAEQGYPAAQQMLADISASSKEASAQSTTPLQATLKNISGSREPKRKKRVRASGQSVESTRKKAVQGDAEAQYDLATMYADGDGVPQDYSQAEEWYHKAAEQGDDEALASLAAIPAAILPDDASSQAPTPTASKISVTVLMEPTSALPYIPIGRFSEGLAPVVAKGIHWENRKYGYIDRAGRIVIPLEYDLVSAFSEGLAVVGKGPEARYTEDGKGPENGREYSFIDKNGKTVIPPLGYDQVWSFSEGRAIVAKGYLKNSLRPTHYGFIDKTGKEVIPVKYTAVGRFSDGLAFAATDDVYHTYGNYGTDVEVKYGYIDKDDNIIIPLELVMSYAPSFPWWNGEGDMDFSEDLARFTDKEKRQGFIDKSGEIVIQPKDAWVYNFSEGLAAVVAKGVGYIDKSGNVIVPPEYEHYSTHTSIGEMHDYYIADPFSEGLAAVMKNARVGYIDKTGKVIIPFEYDAPSGGYDFISRRTSTSFSEGLVVANKGGKYGYLDRAGRVTVPFDYDWATPFSEGVAWVLKGNYISDDGGNRWGLLQIQSDSDNIDQFYKATKEEVLLANVPSNAIKVRNRAELKSALQEGIRTPGVYVALMNDISLGPEPWIPINNFQGTIDGLGHIIKSLTIYCEPDWSRVGYVYKNPNAGLLGSTSAAVTIKNLGIEIGKVSSVDSEDGGVGAIDFINTLAKNIFTKVDSCYSRAGGLIGLVGSQSKVTIDNCFVSGGSLTADVDYNKAGMINSYSYAGGFIGQAYGSVIISNCYASGSNIYSHAFGRKPWLIKKPQSQSFAGGFVGHGGNNISISNSYTTNTVTAKGQNPNSGGLVGGGTANVTNGFYIEKRIINKTDKQGTAISFTDSLFMSLFRTLSGWYVGSVEFNNGWPDLSVFWRDSVIFVETADELQGIGGPRSAGRTYILQNDIPLRASWVPLDNFRGTLDGGGHTISNLNVNLSGNYSYAGLFGNIRTGNVIIKNLHVKSANINIDCRSSDSTVVAGGGGLIGNCSGGNIIIDNCTFDGNVSVSSNANVSLTSIISLLPNPSQNFTTWKIVFEELGKIAVGAAASMFIHVLSEYNDKGNAYAGGLIGFVGNKATVKINNSSAYGSVHAWAARIVASAITPKDKSVSCSGGLIGCIGSNQISIENSTPHNANKLTADGSPQDPFGNYHYTGAISGCNALK